MLLILMTQLLILMTQAGLPWSKSNASHIKN